MEKHAALGERIKQAIELTGKKQVDFAKELGVEPSHLNRWIKGVVAPSYDILAKIGNLTGISLDKIIANKEPLDASDKAKTITPPFEHRSYVDKLIVILNKGNKEKVGRLKERIDLYYEEIQEREIRPSKASGEKRGA